MNKHEWILSGTSASWQIGEGQRGKADVPEARAAEMATRKEMEKSRENNHYPNCRRLLRSGATYKLPKSILINEAVIKMSRALTGVDGHSSNRPVSLVCHITGLMSVTLNKSTHYTLSRSTWRPSTDHSSQRQRWGWGRTYVKQDWHLDPHSHYLLPHNMTTTGKHEKQFCLCPFPPILDCWESGPISLFLSLPMLFPSHENTGQQSCRFLPADASLVNNPFPSILPGAFLTL